MVLFKVELLVLGAGGDLVGVASAVALGVLDLVIFPTFPPVEEQGQLLRNNWGQLYAEYIMYAGSW